MVKSSGRMLRRNFTAASVLFRLLRAPTTPRETAALVSAVRLKYDDFVAPERTCTRRAGFDRDHGPARDYQGSLNGRASTSKDHAERGWVVR
jgi:hypothetical protein